MSKLLEYFKKDELAASVWSGKYQIIREKTLDKTGLQKRRNNGNKD